MSKKTFFSLQSQDLPQFVCGVYSVYVTAQLNRGIEVGSAVLVASSGLSLLYGTASRVVAMVINSQVHGPGSKKQEQPQREIVVAEFDKKFVI
jgi:hypothetical protein